MKGGKFPKIKIKFLLIFLFILFFFLRYRKLYIYTSKDLHIFKIMKKRFAKVDRADSEQQ